MSVELLPCPFCGKKPQLLEPDDSNKLWSVSCLSCVSIDLEELTEERAIQKWNTRYYPAEVQQAVERMKPKKVIPEKVYWAPKNRSAYYFRFLCPTCGGIANKGTNRKFCNKNGCGQALDWSE